MVDKLPPSIGGTGPVGGFEGGHPISEGESLPAKLSKTGKVPNMPVLAKASAKARGLPENLVTFLNDVTAFISIYRQKT